MFEKTFPFLKAIRSNNNRDWYHANKDLYNEAKLEFEHITELLISETGKFDQDILKARKAKGMPTTYYTACGEKHPNGFTFSPPAENTWIGWYAAAEGYTGYLRWAFNNWTSATLMDTRYKTWPAGDCYQVYPGPRTSIRFEKLIEGIQDFEKIRILREQFLKEGNSKGIRELEDILATFKPDTLESTPAADMLTKGKALLNK